MGKSAIFQAWERGYFHADGASTLRAAARAHGFILIPLQVRQYATMAPPETDRPHSWIIEAVRLRLEQSGLATRDRGLIEAMLKSGRFAIALDGTNEADRDTSITEFARQFPDVRLIATSQNTANDPWEVWRLPDTIVGLQEGLLRLWLKEPGASVLAGRIVAEGLGDEIVSGYDLRLIADLARHDPANSTLPTDRIGLYRAILGRARGRDGNALSLDGLTRAAWTMMTKGRRELSAEDQVALGAGVLDALMQEDIRILRRSGPSYEFRHDQMRAFLAASWLVDGIGTLAARQRTMTDNHIFDISRRDQEELWRFFARLINDDDLTALWQFANDALEERVHLTSALQSDAARRSLTLVRGPSGRSPDGALA